MKTEKSRRAKYRTPVSDDARIVHSLVVNTPELDTNSPYYYTIFFRDFSNTSIEAEVENKFAGFVTGYRRPEFPSTLFLWQTATTLDHGVPNLGLDMVYTLVKKCNETATVTHVEATVDAGNRAIRMELRLLARKLSAPMNTDVLFTTEKSAVAHQENLVTIGPLK